MIWVIIGLRSPRSRYCGHVGVSAQGLVGALVQLGCSPSLTLRGWRWQWWRLRGCDLIQSPLNVFSDRGGSRAGVRWAPGGDGGRCHPPVAVQVAACGTNPQAGQGGPGSQMGPGLSTLGSGQHLLCGVWVGAGSPPRPLGGQTTAPDPMGQSPFRARGKRQVHLLWGQTPEISGQAGGVGGALLGSGALLTPPTEAWGCYLHGREEERFGVR